MAPASRGAGDRMSMAHSATDRRHHQRLFPSESPASPRSACRGLRGAHCIAEIRVVVVRHHTRRIEDHGSPPRPRRRPRHHPATLCDGIRGRWALRSHRYGQAADSPDADTKNRLRQIETDRDSRQQPCLSLSQSAPICLNLSLRCCNRRRRLPALRALEKRTMVRPCECPSECAGSCASRLSCRS